MQVSTSRGRRDFRSDSRQCQCSRGPAGRLFVHLCRSVLIFALALVCAPRALHAQDAGQGTINGRVVDASTGNFLQGADVTVAGSSVSTMTARGGTFTISVPAGVRELQVEYPGASPVTQSVEVGAGATVSVTVRVNTDVVELAEFKVSGSAEGAMQALSIQRVSVQAKVVAAADQFGEISEGNVGEYLKFLPGVNVDYNVNDARGVSLRGLSTAFTIVAIDGTPMAGSSSIDDTRRFEFEQIAMNNVETTEIFKTVTPDISASATGGFVNFVTKSAFDHDDVQRITYNVSMGAPSTAFTLGKEGGLWGHGQKAPLRPSIDFNYSRKLGEKWGVNVNYRLSGKYDDAPRIIETWNTTGAGALANPVLTQYTVQNEQKLTEREAFATKIDYRPTDNTKLSFTGQYNFYDLLFNQRGLVFNLGSNPTMNGDAVVSGTAGTRRIDNAQLQRRKHGDTIHFNATLEQRFGNDSVLTIIPYTSKAKGQYDDVESGFISSTQTFTYSAGSSPFNVVRLDGVYDLSKAAEVTLTRGTTQTSVDYLRNLGNYTFSNTANGGNFQSRPWEANDKKSGIGASYVFTPSGSIPLKLNVGANLDRTERDIQRPTVRGAIPTLTGDGLRALMDVEFQRDVAFGFGSIQAVDPYSVWEAYPTALTTLSSNDLRDFEEKNTAAYVRADYNVTDKLLLVGGVRWEDREIDATASLFANNRQQEASSHLKYDNLYPSLSFRYDPRRDMVLRGGVSRTVGHPDYADILPLVREETSPGANDGTITEPDPGLEPYYSTNLDLSFDYYLGTTGVVGVALFYKDVSNFISARAMTAAELTESATRRGYSAADFSSGSLTVNGESATLSGFELSYAQNLSFLPKPLDGLSLQANYSYVDIKSDSLDTYYSASRAVSPKTFNVIVGYKISRFAATLTTNWVDDNLYGGFVNTSYFTGTANANPTLDTRLLRMKEARAQTDLKLEWAFNRHLAVYFQIRNLTNEGRNEYYQGYTRENSHVKLPMRYGEFGEPYYSIGFRGTF